MRLISLDLSLIGRFRFWPISRAILAFVAASFRSRTALQLEILALRHQVCVLQRSVKRPKLTATDRFVWGWLSSVWDGWHSGVFIVKAATVIGWHRKGFGLFWSWKIRRGKPGRLLMAN
jgi:putative transposase